MPLGPHQLLRFTGPVKRSTAGLASVVTHRVTPSIAKDLVLRPLLVDVPSDRKTKTLANPRDTTPEVEVLRFQEELLQPFVESPDDLFLRNSHATRKPLHSHVPCLGNRVSTAQSCRSPADLRPTRINEVVIGTQFFCELTCGREHVGNPRAVNTTPEAVPLHFLAMCVVHKMVAIHFVLLLGGSACPRVGKVPYWAGIALTPFEVRHFVPQEYSD